MHILAIDFGGTRTRAGWFIDDDADDLHLVARRETLSQVDQTPEQVITRLIRIAREVVPNSAQIDAIGIAAPGPLDPTTGVIHYVKTIPNWHEVALAPLVSDAFGTPAFLQNDGNLAVLAEMYRGAARGCDPAIYLTLSTGIGGGAVIDGRLFAGARGMAIEPGHMQFTTEDGEVRRFEELASGTGIGRLAQRRLVESTTPSVLRQVAEVDGKAVGQAASAGDTLALSVLAEAGRWMGLGFVNLIHLFNPQVIVVGGSVATLGDLLFSTVQATIRERVLHPNFLRDDLIRPAQLSDDVCLYGAAYYARSRLSGRS